MTNNETPRSLPCLIRSVHPHLLADSIECNPSFVEPTCRDFDGRLIALDDQVTINSATLDTKFVASSIVGTVVGFRNGLLLVQSTRTGGTEEVRPVRTRVIVTETTTTETTTHEITIVTDGEGNCTAHGAGCRDLTQPRNNRRLGNQETRTYASKREVVETVYGGFEDLEDDPDGWAAFAAHEGFRFMPCCGDLPDEAPTVTPEPVVEDAPPMVVDHDGRPISIGDRVESVPPLGPGTVERFASEGRALVRWDDAGQLGVYRARWLRITSPAPAAPKVPININGETVWLDNRLILALRDCLAGRAGGVTTVDLDRDAVRELYAMMVGPLRSAIKELTESPTDGS